MNMILHELYPIEVVLHNADTLDEDWPTQEPITWMIMNHLIQKPSGLLAQVSWMILVLCIWETNT